MLLNHLKCLEGPGDIYANERCSSRSFAIETVLPKTSCHINICTILCLYETFI